MSLSKPVARVLAPLAALVIALGAFAAVSVSTVTTADAATGKVKLKPKGPYKKNQSVKIKISGFPANAAIAVGFCPAKINPQGPGDCGASVKGYSTLANTNAAGKTTVTLKVPKGKIGALNYPKAKCTNKKKCRVHSSVIGGAVFGAKSKVIKYA